MIHIGLARAGKVAMFVAIGLGNVGAAAFSKFTTAEGSYGRWLDQAVYPFSFRRTESVVVGGKAA
jgi:hypothetical protein